MVNHIWHVGRMRFVSYEITYFFVGPFSLSYYSVHSPSSVRSPDMTEILLFGILNLNLINSNEYYSNLNPVYLSI